MSSALSVIVAAWDLMMAEEHLAEGTSPMVARGGPCRRGAYLFFPANIKLGPGKTLIMFSRTHQWHWHFDNLTSLKYNHPSDFVTSPSP